MQSSGHRLSDSPLWEWQRRYFAEQGVKAWADNVVPDFVTNNCFTAAAFARLALARMEDYAATCNGTPDRVYILEAGAGSGRFAYRFLHFLHQHTDLPCDYTFVLTDFTDSIIDFWRANPRLQTFLDDGTLDFARYDAGSHEPIHLLESGQKIGLGSLKSPLIVIGNYYIDSLPHDLFRMQEGQLQEGQVTFTPPEDGGSQGLDAVLQSVEYVESKAPVYDRSDWESVLDVYREKLDNGTFTFPVRGLQSLQFLADCSAAGCYMIVADKGPNLLDSLRNGRHDEIDKHGAVSVSVNFHAIATWVKQQGGTATQLGHPYHRLNIAAFQHGGQDDLLPRTREAFRREIADFGPDDFANLKDTSMARADAISAQELFSFLRLSNWDPEMILSFFTRLSRLLPSQNTSVRNAFIGGFRKSMELHYPLDERIRYAFLLGGLCAGIAAFQDALRFYVTSIQNEGESADAVFNAALCLARLGASDECRAWLTRAEALGVSTEETDLVRAELD